MENEETVNNELKISKRWLMAVSIFLVATVGLLVYVNYLGVEDPKVLKDNLHKKAFIDSTICQYSCPFTDKILESGETVSRPDLDCLKACVKKLEEETEPGYMSKTGLFEDPLFDEVQEAVVKCREESTVDEIVDNKKMFSCVPTRLEELKQKYDFLMPRFLTNHAL